MDPLSSAVSGIAGAGVQFLGNTILSGIQNRENKQLWKEQIELSKPQTQVNWLRDAGLNPALAYGKGVSTKVESAPTMQRPEAPNPMTDIAAVQQVDNANAQHDLILAQTEQAKAAARLTGIQGDAANHDLTVTLASPIPVRTNTNPIVQGSLGLLDKTHRAIVAGMSADDAKAEQLRKEAREASKKWFK